MGYFVGLPLGGGTEKDCQVRFGKNMTFQVETRAPHLPAEWTLQSGIQLTWPHANTDWAYMLEEVQQCFIAIASEIAKRELLLIVTPEPEEVKKQISMTVNMDNVRFLECETNDTWARDTCSITTLRGNRPVVNDFKFNGWGLKFAADKDNLITSRLFDSGMFKGDYSNNLNFVLEGGSIESDGKGALLTTSECLLSKNRNGQSSKEEIQTYLEKVFGISRMLWLDHGYLSGDDTDSHIDTLARLAPNDTILYVSTDDERDEHFAELKAMECQLQSFTTADGAKYKLLPLPLPAPIFADGERLPATYANFLIGNGFVLVPIYGQESNDSEAMSIISSAFPDRKVLGVDCRALIKQHGSLHCVTMQFPKNSLNI